MATRNDRAVKKGQRPGWVRLRGGVGGRWRHEATGWEVRHCGHPTALWPYFGKHPDGRPVLIQHGYASVAGGYAFRTLALAQTGVEAEIAKGSPPPPGWPPPEPPAGAVTTEEPPCPTT